MHATVPATASGDDIGLYSQEEYLFHAIKCLSPFENGGVGKLSLTLLGASIDINLMRLCLPAGKIHQQGRGGR